MSQPKPDAADIEAVWNQLKQQKFLPQPWWPRFLYHFTDLENAVRILADGLLFSRAALVEKGLPHKDLPPEKRTRGKASFRPAA